MLRVNGGPAGSGTRIVRERGGVWSCDVCLLAEIAAYWANCPSCGEPKARVPWVQQAELAASGTNPGTGAASPRDA